MSNMNQQLVTFKETPNSRSFNVRLWTSNESNSTVLMSDSIGKKVINNKFDVIAISGARVENLDAFLRQNRNYVNYEKIVLMIGGNNLTNWKTLVQESPLTVSLFFKFIYFLFCTNAICPKYIINFIPISPDTRLLFHLLFHTTQ